MKTIAIAALVAGLSAPALAADDKSSQTTDSRTPIVLSAAQLDGVTAAGGIYTTSVTLIDDDTGTSSTGTVKWFNSSKGYGFIQPDGG